MYIFWFPILHFFGISLCLNMYVSASVHVSCVFFDSFTSVCLFCLIMLFVFLFLIRIYFNNFFVFEYILIV